MNRTERARGSFGSAGNRVQLITRVTSTASRCIINREDTLLCGELLYFFFLFTVLSPERIRTRRGIAAKFIRTVLTYVYIQSAYSSGGK